MATPEQRKEALVDIYHCRALRSTTRVSFDAWRCCQAGDDVLDTIIELQQELDSLRERIIVAKEELTRSAPVRFCSTCKVAICDILDGDKV